MARTKRMRQQRKQFIGFMIGFVVILCVVIALIWNAHASQTSDVPYEEQDYEWNI